MTDVTTSTLQVLENSQPCKRSLNGAGTAGRRIWEWLVPNASQSGTSQGADAQEFTIRFRFTSTGIRGLGICARRFPAVGKGRGRGPLPAAIPGDDGRSYPEQVAAVDGRCRNTVNRKDGYVHRNSEAHGEGTAHAVCRAYWQGANVRIVLGACNLSIMGYAHSFFTLRW